MSVTLYRPGNGQLIRGIRCEAQTFDENSFTHHLKSGWFLTPEDCYVKDQESDVSLRKKAKKKEIRDKQNKKFRKIKQEVGEWQREI